VLKNLADDMKNYHLAQFAQLGLTESEKYATVCEKLVVILLTTPEPAYKAEFLVKTESFFLDLTVIGYIA
jgi:hypothetical protein